jgi:hypothetical protein
MKYICAQPATTYFAWQIDVLVSSLVKNNVSPKDIQVLCSRQGKISKEFQDLCSKYKGVSFFFYEDERSYNGYVPSIKQHMLYKHYLANPYMENEDIFLVDADICLTRPLDLTELLKDDVWYVSDTVSYIGYDYILSKGRDILEPMLEIGGISEELVKSNQENAGGAQYLYKKVPATFWKDVVDMSHELYIKISEISKKKKELDPSHHEIQIWTAEMWAMLWVAWKQGIVTRVSDDLVFSWATDPISHWDQRAIYHNAGATTDADGMFYKGRYTSKFPPNNLEIKDTRCCYNYYQMIKETLY